MDSMHLCKCGDVKTYASSTLQYIHCAWHAEKNNAADRVWSGDYTVAYVTLDDHHSPVKIAMQVTLQAIYFWYYALFFYNNIVRTVSVFYHSSFATR